MKTKNWLYWILVLISVITAFSGLTQVIVPGFVLKIISAETTPTSMQLFATIGMFMVLFGGLFLHALLSSSHHPVAVLWASLQKFGAFCAVGLGVLNSIFSPLALFVAFFDLFSGILAAVYLLKIRKES